jgi:ATP/maltotriose-dependent transcriptional regulator MalT/DNA-binding SARP family transcriptional activator
VIKGGRSGTAFAKTTRPTVGSVVAREALFARLDQPAGRTLVWISGPPGSGKTTLAAGYVEARRLRSLWYQVDSEDADPATFFHYLSHAARKLGAARASELPQFMPQHGRDVVAFSRRFFRQLFASGTEPIALVLDNLQAVSPDSELSAVLEAGLAQVPKGCCMIVTSRDEPLASLARARAAGQMSSLTGKDLSLSPDEIVVVARLRGQIVSPESAVKLYERTQGWAAALVLLLEHSRFSGRIAEMPSDTTPQVVFDYLAGEIFDRFDVHTREFLLRVACLPRMTAAVATALANEPRAERLLVNFAQNYYFVREVASEAGRIYELHPLLRDFLRQRAAHALPEAIGVPWLQRAAKLLRDVGQLEDAVALLIEARAWAEIADIALEESAGVLAEGRSETIARWLDLLPAPLVQSNPRLLLASAAARVDASPRSARQLFERAFEGFRVQGDVGGMLRAGCGVVDATVFEFDDIAPLDRWLEVLDGLLARPEAASPASTDAAAALTLLRGTLLRDPGHARIEVWLDYADRLLSAQTETRAPIPSQTLVHMRALVALCRGDLTTAKAALGAVRTDEATLATDGVLLPAVTESLLHLIAGASTRALAGAQEASAAGGSAGIHAYDAWLLAIIAAARLSSGEISEARSALQRLEGEGTRLRRGDRVCVHYLRAWIAALDGDLADAHREAKVALALAIETGVPWLECLARIELAQIQVGSVGQRAIEAQLRAAQDIVERARSAWLGYAVQLAGAATALNAGEKERALEGARSAFRDGHEHGFRQTPGWPPHALADLCALALDAQVEPDFARALVREAKLVPTAPPLRVRRWPWPLRILTFGGFQCLRDESPIEFSAKGPGRPMELLKVLVALGMHDVRADQLADALWPHVEADYAYKSFTATLHRLRRMLDDDEALILRDGRLTLNPVSVWVDTWALADLLDEFDTALRGKEACIDQGLRRASADTAMHLYRGPFLPDEADQPSFIACREQTRARLLRFLARIVKGWEQSNAPREAVDCLVRFIDADDLYEPFYRQLMLCYQRSGAPIEAVATYERLRTVLAARLKTMPSPETQGLYAALKTAGASAA